MNVSFEKDPGEKGYGERDPGEWDPGHRPRQPEGCLVAAFRLPLRIVMFVLVLPVRLVWDALVAVGKAVGRGFEWCGRRVLGPVLRAFGAAVAWVFLALFYWPWAALWTYVLARPLAWLWRHLVAAPAAALHRWVLAPLGHALAAAARGVGKFLSRTGHWLFVVPALALHRWLLAPTGRGLALLARETAAALAFAWHAAGRVTLPLLRFLGRVLRAALVTPFVWAWTWLAAPVARAVRDHLLLPAGRAVRAGLSAVGESVRATRAEIRRVLLGTPRTQEREWPPEGRRVP